MYNNSIYFEYDENKSRSNKEKHGISFEEAKQLWNVDGLEVPARNENEIRFVRIARVNEKFYSCVFTWRRIVIRIISVRRSRNGEIRNYMRVKGDEKAKENN
jgi:uncharacterized protein